LSIRHELNEWLRTIGGHIGYDIRPSRRREGLGKRQLALGLAEARALGLERVLLTCDADNVGSRRIIEGNGGVLEDEMEDPATGKVKLRFWIDL
jgi:predicted acetyltransferase